MQHVVNAQPRIRLHIPKYFMEDSFSAEVSWNRCSGSADVLFALTSLLFAFFRFNLFPADREYSSEITQHGAVGRADGKRMGKFDNGSYGIYVI